MRVSARSSFSYLLPLMPPGLLCEVGSAKRVSVSGEESLLNPV